MIDALLFAVRDAIWGAGFGYDGKTCDVRDAGEPKPQMGAVWISVHQADSSSKNDNCLMEYFGFNLTLTMRVVVPLDRVGDRLLAVKMARKAGPNGQPGFNARAEQLRAFMHMNWATIGIANNNMVAWETEAPLVYGFTEPARYRGMEIPQLMGPDWLSAEPEGDNGGLKAQLDFRDARRLQAIASYV